MICCHGFEKVYDEKNQAKGQKIDCLSDEECKIKISGDKAGKRSTINCPSNNDCYIECIGKKSCSKSKIICPQNGDCYIKCKGDVSCERAEINGPQSGNLLQIVIDGERGAVFSKINSESNENGILRIVSSSTKGGMKLFESDIQCPKNGECILRVKGNMYVYQHAKIVATSSKSLLVEASGDGALFRSDIYCPDDGADNKKQNCVIELKHPSAEDKRVMQECNIYAVEQFKDLKLICKGNDCGPSVANGTDSDVLLNCKTGYTENCRLRLNNDKWSCADKKSDCNSYKLKKDKANEKSKANEESDKQDL